MIPKTTTIGSYPTFPKPEDIEYYLTISSHGSADDVIDPYLWSIDEALEDFTSAGIEVPPRASPGATSTRSSSTRSS